MFIMSHHCQKMNAGLRLKTLYEKHSMTKSSSASKANWVKKGKQCTIKLNTSKRNRIAAQNEVMSLFHFQTNSLPPAFMSGSRFFLGRTRIFYQAIAQLCYPMKAIKNNSSFVNKVPAEATPTRVATDETLGTTTRDISSQLCGS